MKNRKTRNRVFNFDIISKSNHCRSLSWSAHTNPSLLYRSNNIQFEDTRNTAQVRLYSSYISPEGNISYMRIYIYADKARILLSLLYFKWNISYCGAVIFTT